MSLLTGKPRPILLFGRPILPLVFGFVMITLSFFWFQVVANYSTVDGLAENPLVDIEGFISGGTGGVLIMAWWFRSHTLLMIGLALTVGVMVSRSAGVYILDDFTNSYSVMSPLIWAMVALLTWRAELQGPPVDAKKAERA